MVGLSEKSLEDALFEIESSKDILNVKPTRLYIPGVIAQYIEENNIDVEAIVSAAEEKLNNG